MDRSGFLLIDKPAGMTSHDVIDRLRRLSGIRTIGHAGTLDPFATGLLIVAVGKAATTKLQQCVGLGKTYEADILLGQSSTTLDPEGEIRDAPCPDISAEDLAKAMSTLTGNLLQIPPMHSAIKINGQKLYDLARKGIEVERPPRPVTVSEFSLLNLPSTIYHLPHTFHTRIRCSSGTYIRAIARDLGKALETAGYLTALRRTAIGQFTLENAVPLDKLTPENWFDCLSSDMIA